MKRLIILFTAISPVLLFGQTDIDRDGDGISDVTENAIHKQFGNQKGYETYFNPDIADIPSASITFTGSINIGLVYTIRATTDTKGTIEINQTNSTETEDYKKTYNSNTIKNKTEIEASAGFSPKGFLWGFSIKNNFSTDATSGIEIRKEQTDKWRDEYKKLQSQITSNQVGYNETAGYIKANLNFFNPSTCHRVIISKVILNAYAYNISTGQKDDKPLLHTIEVNLKADNAGNDAKNEITLDPGKKPTNRLIEVKNLNSNDIIQMLNDGKSIIFEIESYDIALIDENVLPKQIITLSGQKDALAVKTFKLRIFDGINDVTYYIAKKDSAGNFNTIRKALSYIYNDKVEFKETSFDSKSFGYIYRVDNKMSNLNPQAKPTDYTEENLSQGFWFKLIREGTTFSGDLDAPLNELNIDITLVYLTGKDLKPLPKKDFTIVGNKVLDVTENNPISTGINVTKNDKIQLNLTPYLIQYNQNYTSETYSFTGTNIAAEVYHRGSVSEVWNYQSLTKSDLQKIKLYFKFNGIDKIYTLSDFKNLQINFSPPNTWKLEFELPTEIQANINYELIVLPNQNSFASKPQTFYEGIIQSDYETLNNRLALVKQQIGDAYGTYANLQNYLNSNFYKNIIKYSKIRYVININSLRQQ